MALSSALVGVFALVIFGAVLVLGAGAYLVSVYNRLVRVDERVDNAWSDVEVVLKQRRSALEKLVDTAQEAMDYESGTLTDLVEAREAVDAAESPAEAAAADQQVRAALGTLARAEDNPELQAAGALRDLAEETARLEETIADRREVYNEAVTTNNTLRRSFPSVLVAGYAGVTERELFEAPEAETTDVDVGDLFAEPA